MAARSLQVKKKISSRIWCVEKLFHKSLYFFFTTFHFFVVLRNRVDLLFFASIERSYSQKKVAIMLSKRDWRNILPCETRKLSLLYIFLLLSVCVTLNDDFQMRGRLSSRSLWHWYDETSSIPEDVLCCYSSSVLYD